MDSIITGVIVILMVPCLITLWREVDHEQEPEPVTEVKDRVVVVETERALNYQTMAEEEASDKNEANDLE